VIRSLTGIAESGVGLVLVQSGSTHKFRPEGHAFISAVSPGSSHETVTVTFTTARHVIFNSDTRLPFMVQMRSGQALIPLPRISAELHRDITTFDVAWNVSNRGSLPDPIPVLLVSKYLGYLHLGRDLYLAHYPLPSLDLAQFQCHSADDDTSHLIDALATRSVVIQANHIAYIQRDYEDMYSFFTTFAGACVTFVCCLGQLSGRIFHIIIHL
jgi:hypothetical protein